MIENPLAHLPEADRRALRLDLIAAINEAMQGGGLNNTRIREILGPHVGPQAAAIWDLPQILGDLAFFFAHHQPERVPRRQPGIVRAPRELVAGGRGEYIEALRIDVFDEAHEGHRGLFPLHRRHFNALQADQEVAGGPVAEARPLPHLAEAFGHDVGGFQNNAGEQQPPLNQQPELENVQPHNHADNNRAHEIYLARQRRPRAQVNDDIIGRQLQQNPELLAPRARELQQAGIQERARDAQQLQGLGHDLQHLHIGERPQPGQVRAGTHHRHLEARRLLQRRRNARDVRDPALPQEDHLDDGNGQPVDERLIQAPVHQRPLFGRIEGHALGVDNPPVNEAPARPRPRVEIQQPALPLRPPPRAMGNQPQEYGECQHRQWSKVKAKDQQCPDCLVIMPKWILECTNCAIRRCNRCKRRQARA